MKITKAFGRLRSVLTDSYRLPKKVADLQMALGRVELRQLQVQGARDLHSNEFKVSSQWGEDGILQYLLRHISNPKKIFVEFGVGDYSESNTRFLMQHDNWEGLVIDGSTKWCAKIMADSLYCVHRLHVECAFITRANVNDIISKHYSDQEIGILSVDIDGNDYWIWEQISCVNPQFVVCEYNSLFGPEAAVSTPYKDDFYIFDAHFSGLYWGASIAAFTHLAKAKGYQLVGSNSAGKNVFLSGMISQSPFRRQRPKPRMCLRASAFLEMRMDR